MSVGTLLEDALGAADIPLALLARRGGGAGLACRAGQITVVLNVSPTAPVACLLAAALFKGVVLGNILLLFNEDSAGYACVLASVGVV